MNDIADLVREHSNLEERVESLEKQLCAMAMLYAIALTLLKEAK